MARSVAWRRSPSDAASWHQDQSQSAIIYILRETGPTGFLLKEEGETKKYKVFLGDPHSCTCSGFNKEKDLCKHICWVLLKKFRVPRENPLSFQLGLVEREINELLQGIAKKEQRPSRRAVELAKKVAGSQDEKHATGDGREVLQQKEITEDDVCPICQDELLEKREPVTYCRYGCGKSTHIRCMKVWAEHQKSTGEVIIRCPLCREDYGQLGDLQAEYRTATLQKTRQERRDDIHMGVVCKGCNQSPVTGKCYRCSQCFDFSLCHACFSNNVHEEHSFQFRQKPTQRWRPAKRGSGGALPQAVMEDLLSRDISEEDYDLLLQLDSDAANKPSNIPEKVIKSFPTETIRQGSAMLLPGTQCRVCLRGYEIGQVVRRLPCRHKYHISCIDQWLLHEHPTCPVDGTVVWNPLTAETPRQRRQQRPQSLDRQNSTNQDVGLEIPGIGVSVRHGSVDRSTGRLGSQRQRVERITGDQEGLDPLFALTGSGISSGSSINESRQTSRSQNQSSQRQAVPNRPQRQSTASKRNPNPSRNASIDDLRLMNSLSAVAPGVSAIGRQDDHTRQEVSGVSLPNGRTETHANNHRQNQRLHGKPPAGLAKPRHHSGNSQSDSAIDNYELNHHMDGLAIGNAQVAVSPGRLHKTNAAAAGPGWRPPPVTLPNERSHISSIPLPREAAMTPLGNLQQSMSPGNRRPPVSDAGGGGTGERGRRNSRNELSRRGSRSSSASGRAGSRNRSETDSASQRQDIENMFLGSPTGNLAISQSSSAPGSPSNRVHRSHHPRGRSKPYHPSSASNVNQLPLDIALTGNRVSAPTP